MKDAIKTTGHRRAGQRGGESLIETTTGQLTDDQSRVLIRFMTRFHRSAKYPEVGFYYR